MRFVLCGAAISWLVIACGAEPEPKPDPLPMTIKLLTPTPLTESRYRVVAEITNFDPAANLHGQLNVQNKNHDQIITLDAVSDSRIEVDTGTLTAFSPSEVTINLTGESLVSLHGQLSWMTGPPAITMVSAVVGDAGTITMTGYGLGDPIGMRLGIFATLDASEMPIKLLNFTRRDDATVSAVVPVLLSTDQTPIFPGRVPPSNVYLLYLDPSPQAVGTTQLAYRISAPTPASGTAGSTFEVALFHPARAPDLAGVTVSFDDIALAPLSVQELGDITIGGFIYLTRSQFRVPATAGLGVHQITAKTSYGESLLANAPDFTVVAAAR